MDDTISRQVAINALWKAQYDYEKKTEKQFIESEELDIWDWVQHRIFVQNMGDIDRRTILDLPSAEQHEQITSEMDEIFRIASEIRLAVGCNTSRECWELARKGDIQRVRHGRWVEYPIADGMNQCSVCGGLRFGESNYCPYCGAKMEGKR